jgi:hypothetical protein
VAIAYKIYCAEKLIELLEAFETEGGNKRKSFAGGDGASTDVALGCQDMLRKEHVSRDQDSADNQTAASGLGTVLEGNWALPGIDSDHISTRQFREPESRAPGPSISTPMMQGCSCLCCCVLLCHVAVF